MCSHPTPSFHATSDSMMTKCRKARQQHRLLHELTAKEDLVTDTEVDQRKEKKANPTKKRTLTLKQERRLKRLHVMAEAEAEPEGMAGGVFIDENRHTHTRRSTTAGRSTTRRTSHEYTRLPGCSSLGCGCSYGCDGLSGCVSLCWWAILVVTGEDEDAFVVRGNVRVGMWWTPCVRL